MRLPPPTPDDLDVPQDVEATAALLLDVAFRVHRALGPGLLESVYRRCLAHGLRRAGATVVEEGRMDIEFEGLRIESGLRLDLLVNGHLVVELKAVEALHPVHEAQVLSYLRLSRRPLGLLLNFNVPLLKHGIRRFVNPRALDS